jgi:hypothetical protein
MSTGSLLRMRPSLENGERGGGRGEVDEGAGGCQAERGQRGGDDFRPALARE